MPFVQFVSKLLFMLQLLGLERWYGNLFKWTCFSIFIVICFTMLIGLIKLAFGDSAGRIGVWDLARSQCRQSGMGHSTHGPVLRCVFSRLSGDYSLAVQHQTSIAIWDTERFAPVQYFQRPGLSVIDMDMCGLTPVYIASDGAFRLAISTEKENRNGPISDSGQNSTNYLSIFNSKIRIVSESEP